MGQIPRSTGITAKHGLLCQFFQLCFYKTAHSVEISYNSIEAKRTHRIFGMENVGCWRVIQNDDVSELSTQAAEVFDVVAPVEHTGLPEEPCVEHTPLVQQVCHRVSVLHRGERLEVRGASYIQVSTECLMLD